MSTTDKPKRGPGRPRLPACEQLSEHVATTVTPAEADAVARTAALCNESVAFWVRGLIRAALEDAVSVPMSLPTVLTKAERADVVRVSGEQGVPVSVWLRQAIRWALEDAGGGEP